MRAHRKAMIRHTKHAETVAGYRVEQLHKTGGGTETVLEFSFEDGATLRIVMDWTEAEPLRSKMFAVSMKD